MTIIETADGEERMRSSHKCIKTFFVRNRMGDLVPISVPALFVRGLPQDLIGGKAVNKVNILYIRSQCGDNSIASSSVGVQTPCDYGSGPTRQSEDSEPDYLLRPTRHGPGDTLLIIAHSFLERRSLKIQLGSKLV